MSRDLLDLVRELNSLNDDNLAERVVLNNDVQWCLGELQDILDVIGAMPVSRLRELAQADRDGRCFVSPVEVGQTVWFVRDPKRHPENIVQTTVQKIVYKHGGAYMKLECNSLYETSCNSIGKTVFLTKESALKGEQDG